MQIIDLRAWVIKDLKRKRHAIIIGNQNKHHPKRWEHMRKILSVYASQDKNTVTFNITNTSPTILTYNNKNWIP